jgi:acetylglutamate kinase
MEYSYLTGTNKADVLIEALPYIQAFNGKIVVVKYGGSAMVDKEIQKNVIKDVALLKLVGMKPVIVHGGGKEISKWVGLLGKEPVFVGGKRVTDAETMEVCEMVLNKVNKNLVQLMEQNGIKSAGICGKDGNTLHVKRATVDGQDIGFVGDIDKVDTALIRSLIEQDFVPVVAPIGLDDDFQAYNINADDAACAIAEALDAQKLTFLTDIEGVCLDPNDKSTLIPRLSTKEAKELVKKGNIGGGMLPKINNCIDAIEKGVGSVHILDGRMAHCLLLEFFTDKGIGTAIYK